LSRRSRSISLNKGGWFIAYVLQTLSLGTARSADPKGEAISPVITTLHSGMIGKQRDFQFRELFKSLIQPQQHPMSNNAVTAIAATTPQVSSVPPNQTLYIKNLNQKINKQGTHIPTI
jgi:hypothetical protein